MFWLKRNKKNLFFIAFLFILLLPSVFSLLLPGYFESDDGEWMVIRFSAFYQALSDGQFPVRFLGRLNFGYGYPVANFLYPGFMYLATPIQILGFGFVNSIKVIMLVSVLGSGFFAYLWLSKIFDRTSALVGAVFYTYTPYHLFDLYKRGSVGEVLSLLWVSFILWSLEEKNKLFLSIGIFLLAISHNTMFLFFTPLVFVYALLRKKITVKDLSIYFGLGILMSSFFTIPAIYELSYTNFSSIKISNISEHFASFNLIGLSSILVLIGSIVIVYLHRFKAKKEVYLFILVSVFSIFLSVSLSEVVWRILPSSLVQFPFRMLSFLILSSAFLSSYVLFSLKEKKKFLLPLLLVVIAFSSINYFFPTTTSNKEDSIYATNEATTTVKDEYMPKWVKEKPSQRFQEKIELSTGGKVGNLSYDSKRIYFETSEEGESLARVNTIFYPGWQGELNNKRANLSYDSPKGIIEIKLPKGDNKVELRFGETPVRLFADILSIAAFILLIIMSRKSLFKIFKK